jgi:hypothetical protein
VRFRPSSEYAAICAERIEYSTVNHMSESHQRFVNGDLGQPGAEPRLRMELPNVLKGFQHRLLGHVFGVGPIKAREALRQGYAPCVRCMKKYLTA